MKKRSFRYEDGGEVEMEEGAGGYGALSEPEPEAEKPKAKAAPKPKATPPAGAPGGGFRGQRTQTVEITGKRLPKDDESKSVSERMKAARERARMGSTGTDERSVTERMGGSERKGSSTPTDTRSLAERAKAMRETARAGSSGTDTRSVSERIRSAMGFAKGGSVKGAGIAQRGVRKCKVV